MALTQVFPAGQIPTATELNESSIPVVSSTSDIANPYVGQLIFNTTDTRIYRCASLGPTVWRVFTGGPNWALSRGTVQPIPNSAWTTLNWTEEDVDNGNVHPTNGDTVVINQPGLYAIATKPSFTGSASGLRAGRLTKNGTADANTIKGTSVIVNNVGTNVCSVPVPLAFVQCALNDVIRAQAWQNITGGGALNTSVASLGDQPLFTGTWLRD